MIGLVGCASISTRSPHEAQSPAPATTAPSATSPAPSTATTKPTAAPTGKPSVQLGGTARVCSVAGTYLTAVRTGERNGYDRIVQFSGTLPGHAVERVQAVYSDAKGTPIPLAGQSYLRVVFHGTSAVCPKPLHRTYTGPAVLTPYHPELLTVSAAGDFEGVLSFGIGLAARGGYHAFTPTSPARLVIDVSHAALGKFPGIWDITSWRSTGPRSTPGSTVTSHGCPARRPSPRCGRVAMAPPRWSGR